MAHTHCTNPVWGWNPVPRLLKKKIVMMTPTERRNNHNFTFRSPLRFNNNNYQNDNSRSHQNKNLGNYHTKRSSRSRLPPCLYLSSSSSSSPPPSSSSNRQQQESSGVGSDIGLIKSENILLRETIRKLEEENIRLKQRNAGSRIVLETFEGERFFRDNRNNHPNDAYASTRRNLTTDTDGTADSVVGEFGGMSSTSSSLSSLNGAGGGGGGGITLTEEELSSDMEQELWCDVLDDGQCPVEPTISFGEALRDRAFWLVGLLVMQSLSGIILSRNEALLTNHPVIVYYLTMMVGAGK
jgi:hypothetical protein